MFASSKCAGALGLCWRASTLPSLSSAAHAASLFKSTQHHYATSSRDLEASAAAAPTTARGLWQLSHKETAVRLLWPNSDNPEHTLKRAVAAALLDAPNRALPLSALMTATDAKLPSATSLVGIQKTFKQLIQEDDWGCFTLFKPSRHATEASVHLNDCYTDLAGDLYADAEHEELFRQPQVLWPAAACLSDPASMLKRAVAELLLRRDAICMALSQPWEGDGSDAEDAASELIDIPSSYGLKPQSWRELLAADKWGCLEIEDGDIYLHTNRMLAAAQEEEERQQQEGSGGDSSSSSSSSSNVDKAALLQAAQELWADPDDAEHALKRAAVAALLEAAEDGGHNLKAPSCMQVVSRAQQLARNHSPDTFMFMSYIAAKHVLLSDPHGCFLFTPSDDGHADSTLEVLQLDTAALLEASPGFQQQLEHLELWLSGTYRIERERDW